MREPEYSAKLQRFKEIMIHSMKYAVIYNNLTNLQT